MTRANGQGSLKRSRAARGRRRPGAGPAAKSPYGEALRVAEITPAAVKERLSRRLSEIIGPGKRVGYAEAARLTGIRVRTLRSYVDGSACPNLARYERMLRVFGPEIGIDLAHMLGWEPRGSARPQPSIAHLVELRRGIAEALAAIEHVLEEIKDEQSPILKGRP